MDVSIIIINYNTLELTKNTISSILEKTEDINYEIILVDNNSIDGSQEYFSQEYYIDKIKLIKSDINLGFGKANNLGMKISQGKYVFLLNSDILLVNNAIKILYDFMEKNKNIGVSGGNLYDENMNPTHSYGKLPNLFIDFIDIYFKLYLKIMKKRLDFNYKNIPKEVDYITGADMFIRKKILNEIGYFDPDFFMYFEETELTYRIKNKGYKIVSVPEAKIIHLEGKSFKFKEIRFKMMCESKYKYYYKIYGKNKMIIVFLLAQIKYLLLFNKVNRQKFIINYKKFIDKYNN